MKIHFLPGFALANLFIESAGNLRAAGFYDVFPAAPQIPPVQEHGFEEEPIFFDLSAANARV